MNASAAVHGLTVTHLIMISVAIVSVIGFASEPVKRALIFNADRVRRGEVYRMLTAGWLHADLTHLALNLYVLYGFAARVRITFGDLPFLAFYVSAVVAAHVPTLIRYWKQPRYSSLGASGAVAAVMLSAILLDGHLQVGVPFIPVRVPGIVFGVLYMIYSVWSSRRAKDNVNHDAHLAGAVYGIIITAIAEPAKVEATVRVLMRMVGM